MKIIQHDDSSGWNTMNQLCFVVCKNHKSHWYNNAASNFQKDTITFHFIHGDYVYEYQN